MQMIKQSYQMNFRVVSALTKQALWNLLYFQTRSESLATSYYEFQHFVNARRLLEYNQ